MIFIFQNNIDLCKPLKFSYVAKKDWKKSDGFHSNDVNRMEWGKENSGGKKERLRCIISCPEQKINMQIHIQIIDVSNRMTKFYTFNITLALIGGKINSEN